MVAINGGDTTRSVAVLVLQVDGHVRRVKRPQGWDAVALGSAVGRGPARGRARRALGPVVQQQADALRVPCKTRVDLVM